MAAKANEKPDTEDSIGLITTVTVVVLAGGLILPILGGSVGRTSGARSSMRLEYQRRAAEVQRVIAQQEADAQRRTGHQNRP